MKRIATTTVLALLAVVLASGCTMNRRPGMCALAGGILGAGAGGATAGVLRYNVADNTPSDATMAVVTGAGALGGALLGATLGHFLCDPIEEPAAQAAPAETPPPSGTEIVEIQGTHFAFGSATLTAEGERILDQAVAVMNQHPSVNVRIEGHTDSVGSDAYNMRLGQRRADAVEAYLVGKGIAASRLSTVSYGETRPAASNDTAEGRAQNRRVELIVE
jgi:outer membrane protein OmpA-like peptidoglycan-associated protein